MSIRYSSMTHIFSHKFRSNCFVGNPKNICKFTTKSISNQIVFDSATTTAAASANQLLNSNGSTPISGFEDVMMGYMLGKKKATEVAHSVWKQVIKKGDVVVDATCGNGYDTLAMLKMVADNSLKGRVYALDIQEVALRNTQSLLNESLDDHEKELFELFATCHSKMEEIVPTNATVRLVAFNLGYLPGGDKTMITRSDTTLLGLESAERIVAAGGLISLVVYVGHPGGREEFEVVQAFASRLPVDKWICCQLQMLNKPLAPIILFLFKR